MQMMGGHSQMKLVEGDDEIEQTFLGFKECIE